MNQKFPRSRRLTSKADFNNVFTNGKKISHHGITAWMAAAPYPRLGFAISKRFGNNVKRNQFRRRVRAVFRTHYHQLPAADLVITTSRDQGTAEYREIEDLFRIIANRSETSVEDPGG